MKENIKIDPANGPITVGVQSRSLVVVGFTITVYKPDGTTVEDYYPEKDTNTNNPCLVLLPKAAANYIGHYIAATLKFEDPAGGGGQYAIDVFLSQPGQKLEPVIKLSGTLDPGINSNQASYHIQ